VEDLSYYSQLLNVHNVSNIRQIELHAAEPLVPNLSTSEIEIAIAKLKKYKLLDSDQILGGRTDILTANTELSAYKMWQPQHLINL
jgi:hypothetical protein